MIVKATSSDKKTDLKDRCSKCILTAQGDEEAEFLAALNRALFFGGRVTVTERHKMKGKPKRFTLEFQREGQSKESK